MENVNKEIEELSKKIQILEQKILNQNKSMNELSKNVIKITKICEKLLNKSIILTFSES